VCLLTWLQVKLAEVLGRAERDHDHTVALYILSLGHLEGEVRSGDQAVLLHHRVHRLHPAVPEVNPEQTQKHNVNGIVCIIYSASSCFKPIKLSYL